jgi:hypothetical protein
MSRSHQEITELGLWILCFTLTVLSAWFSFT